MWDDPWSDGDPVYTQVRLRAEVLPLLEEVLGEGVAPALARTAAMLREDLDALDELAATELAALCGVPGRRPARGGPRRPAGGAAPAGAARG